MIPAGSCGCGGRAGNLRSTFLISMTAVEGHQYQQSERAELGRLRQHLIRRRGHCGQRKLCLHRRRCFGLARGQRHNPSCDVPGRLYNTRAMH
jgi:hypothetical protein